MGFYFGRPLLALFFLLLVFVLFIGTLAFGVPDLLSFISAYSGYLGGILSFVVFFIGAVLFKYRRSHSVFSRWYVAALCGLILSGALVLIARSFVFQPFSIASSSMYPTFIAGDYIPVKKYAYGYSRHSVPFSMLSFDGRIFSKKPEYGDIVVFKQSNADYVKRIVALPGDQVQLVDGKVYLNGASLKYNKAGRVERNGKTFELFEEFMPNSVSYVVASEIDDSLGDNTGLLEVPENHYFMMGDHRDNSFDSRFDAIGFIPFDNILGRVDAVFLNRTVVGE
ncbi:Signal peptidase I [Nymphon striatum]|nr:Signal peptidase I [Nymphon striatum]